MPGVRYACRTQAGRTSYEIAVPLRLVKGTKAGVEGRLVVDLSFPEPDAGADAPEPPEPMANTFAYRVRYGSDTLIPIHFVELTLGRRP